MTKLVLIIHNVRSAHNVGSMLRTADGLGIEEVYLTGYTPYPPAVNDKRLPHIRQSTGRRIHKTALGAEKTVKWQHTSNVKKLIKDLKLKGFTVAALEQTAGALDISKYHSDSAMALLVGTETTGLVAEIIALCDDALMIPMLGQKESFNVAVAAAIALYHLRYK
ncbi:hypothetical protein A3F65_01800 [Candidatus Saccharibacteria bacterium RIFCSPHIGHO2_12_FULL_47_16b]|nr:MAG: hypothetical protein A3F65_01800 [Candidatus Saccharibacteria bacterium RIFCSPHIGHO2_12_FULL_47_16b]